MSERLHGAIAECEREVALRKGVYPKWVDSKKMSQEKASDQIRRMENAVDLLKWFEDKGDEIKRWKRLADWVEQKHPEVVKLMEAFPGATLDEIREREKEMEDA